MSYNPDYYHIGNGVACWYYNHDTCMRGINCDYSHAPDIRSVRDSQRANEFAYCNCLTFVYRGRNVCLHYLQGCRMFGEFPYRYSHDRRFLPPNLSHCPAHTPPSTVEIHLPPVPDLAEPVKPPKSAARKQVRGNSMVVKGRAVMDPGSGILIR